MTATELNIRGILTLQVSKRVMDRVLDVVYKRHEEVQKMLKEKDDLLALVNDHAETCAIFIYDERPCTCFFEKIQEAR